MSPRPPRSRVRYAPSPTGILHVGNLRTAALSHALARAVGGEWWLRFEDIDAPRVQRGARERQREDLAALGLVAAGETLQSESLARHRGAFARAVADGRAYPCFCSRREILEAVAGLASAPQEGDGGAGPGPGTAAGDDDGGICRSLASAAAIAAFEAGVKQGRSALGWRFRGREAGLAGDPLIGRTPWSLEAPAEEFAPAYPWACALDDLDEEHAWIVRAWDLRPALDAQRAIQRWYRPDAELPRAFHASLVRGPDGRRLEKRTPGVTRAELVAAGMTDSEILSALRASLPDDADLSRAAAGIGPEGIGGESARELQCERGPRSLRFLAVGRSATVSGM